MPRITNEEKLNSQIDDRNKNPPQPPHIKIQLWSNRSKSDYAIKLKARTDTPLAATKNTEEYTDLVEESDYLEDLQYDWNYTLRHWIDIHSRNSISDVIQPFPNDTTKVTVRKMPRQKKYTQNATPKYAKCHTKV